MRGPLKLVLALFAALVFAPAQMGGCSASSGGGDGGGSGGGGGGGGGGGSDLPWDSGSYYPAWRDVLPLQSIAFDYDPGRTQSENGADLAAAINALTPGQMLRIGPGTYSIAARFDVQLQGTAAAPIWIVAHDLGNKPVITRPDNAQNAMNVGSGSATAYVCFRALDITGGDDLIKLYSCSQVWIDQCVIHEGDGVGIAANSADTHHLYITRNEIFDPGSPTDTAEGMYLGANHSACRMTYSTIALNHVHDTQGTQGDGIEVKQGSYNNWIVGNHVHDCNYPCILVYGTDALGTNLIERNVLHGSNDNTMQVQGEATVRNNLIMDGACGFASTDHQGQTLNLRFVHNTVVNAGRATNLSSWNARVGMVFANNVVYSRDAESIRFPNGAALVTLAGNVFVGATQGVATGCSPGNGLTDFVDLTWDATHRDGTPSPGSAIAGRGSAPYAVTDDIGGTARVGPLDSGAFDQP